MMCLWRMSEVLSVRFVESVLDNFLRKLLEGIEFNYVVIRPGQVKEHENGIIVFYSLKDISKVNEVFKKFGIKYFIEKKYDYFSVIAWVIDERILQLIFGDYDNYDDLYKKVEELFKDCKYYDIIVKAIDEIVAEEVIK